MITQPAIAPSLEELEVDKVMDSYERATVPPDVPEDDFGRGVLRCAFVSGFGSMLAIASRLERETPERRDAILKMLEVQMWASARRVGNAGRATS